MTFRNHTDDFPQNKWSLSSINSLSVVQFSKICFESNILARQESNSTLCPCANVIFVQYIKLHVLTKYTEQLLFYTLYFLPSVCTAL